MGFWVVENVTGIVKDYSPDGSINYDSRFHTTRQNIDLPLGDQAQQYRWDGTKIVKQAPPPPSPLAQALDTLLALPTPTPQQIVAVLRVWRQGLS